MLSPVDLFNLPITDYHFVVDTRSRVKYDVAHVMTAWHLDAAAHEDSEVREKFWEFSLVAAWPPPLVRFQHGAHALTSCFSC